MRCKGHGGSFTNLLAVFALLGWSSGVFAETAAPTHSRPESRAIKAGSSITAPRGKEAEAQKVKLLRADDQGLDIEILSSGLSSSVQQVEGRVYHHIRLEEAALSMEEGKPQLPVRTISFGIPPEVDVAVEVVEMETERDGGYQVYPAPRRMISQTSSGEPLSIEEFHIDQQLYAHNLFYPTLVAEVIRTGFIRDQRVAQLEVRPVQVNPVTGELLFHRRVVVRLNFVGGTDWKYSTADRGDLLMASRSPFETILSNMLLNYESSKDWRLRRTALPRPMSFQMETPYEDPNAYRITVSEDGMYILRYDDLVQHGLVASSIDPKRVKMYNQGRQIPVYVRGSRDGQFDPGDYIVFWGELYHGDDHYYSPYTETNVYWLVPSGEGIGLRMVEQDGGLRQEDPNSLIFPQNYKASFRREVDREFQRLSQVTNESADRWLWQELDAPDSVQHEFHLEGVEDSAECEIEVRLRGITFPNVPYGYHNHHTEIRLNGILLENKQWDDQQEYIYHGIGLPNSLLWEGRNILKIKSHRIDIPQVGDVDKIYTNWFEINYWRGYIAEDDYLEFSSPEGGERGLHQFRIAGFTTDDIALFDLAGKRIINFEVSLDDTLYALRFQDNVVRPTRYLALARSRMKSPDGIYPNQASDLRDAANGADYIIIVHSDLYQSVQPLAAYRESQGLRVKVVRVQDIYDEFNDGVLSPEAIRDFLKYTFNHWQQPAPTYVLLVGDTSWGYDKSVTHQTYWQERCLVPTLMAWTSAWGVSASDNRLACVVGDDRFPDLSIGRLPVRTEAEAASVVDKILQYEANPEIGPWRKRIQLLAGEGTIFERHCVDVDSAFVPPCYEAPRIYTTSGSIHFGATQDLIDQWNQGVVLASFTGHGGGSVWFDANFFLLEHIPLLQNPRRLPVVFSLTCFVGYFDNPWSSSLGEEILRAEDKGAVSHFGSSGVAWAAEDNLLGENLFSAIFRDGERALGIITTQGKLGPHYISSELVDVFNLLGDPATNIALPEHEIQLGLDQSSLALGESISIQGFIPGNPTGTVKVAMGDVDTSGWLADTTFLQGIDKIHSPRIAVVQESLTVNNGLFSLDILPPDTLVAHPFYEPSAGHKAITAYFWNQETDAIAWAPFSLDSPFLVEVWHQPERPAPWQNTYVHASVELGTGLDPDGLDSLICHWGLRPSTLFNRLNMSLQEGVTYKTDAPISAQGGAYVYYQITVKYGGVAGSPSSHIYQTGIRYYQVQRTPNLAVSSKDMHLGVADDQLWIRCWVHNRGGVDLDSVEVWFYDDKPDSNQIIGKDLIDVISTQDSALAQVPWEAPGEKHDLYVSVDPEGNLDEAPDYDNRTHRVFSNQFLVTPQHGTTVRGENVRVCHTDGNVACRISGTAVDKSGLLLVGNKAPDEVSYAQRYDPAALEQPGLSWAVLRDSTRQPYGLVLEDSSVALNTAAVTFWYHPEDSLNQLALSENNLKICRVMEEIGKWILESDQEVDVDSTVVTASTDHLGVFALCVVDDRKPPQVKINVEGQSFANGDYISAHPIISAAIEDENGIDAINRPVEMTLNGNSISSSEFSSVTSPGASNLHLVSYMPDLSPGSYTLAMRAYDCVGNTAADTISFNVTAGFKIPFVANHPNPFQSETVFAYVVASDSPAQQVIIRIYTVRGHLIREFVSRDVGPGYMEVVWDGRDRDGEQIANGVYYYKMTVIDGDGNKIAPIVGKIAKLE